jgi:hypothetical protein
MSTLGISIQDIQQRVLMAARHEGGLKIQPCLQVDPAWFGAMQIEARELIAGRVASDVGEKSHPTNWVRPFGQATQFNLFNRSGNTEDCSTDFSGAMEGHSFAAPECPSLRRFFDCFAARVLSFRLNGLMTNSGLGAHEEAIVKQESVRMRFHLPVFTNAGASVLLDDEEFHLKEGYVYYFNNGCVHAAQNRGPENRYHFVWDMWLDPWVFANLLDLGSAVVPDSGLRKLSEGEALRLSEGKPSPTEQYVIGTATGEILLARKQRTADGRTRIVKASVTENADITEGAGDLSLGEGWYPLESYQGERFRWVDNDAKIEVWSEIDGAESIAVELEPGPGQDGGALNLTILDSYGCEIKRVEISHRQRIPISLPVHAGQTNVFQLHSNGGGKPIAGDPRILNFRVFHIGPGA